LQVVTEYKAEFGALTGKAGMRVNVWGREYDEGQMNTAADVTGTIAA